MCSTMNTRTYISTGRAVTRRKSEASSAVVMEATKGASLDGGAAFVVVGGV